MSSQHHPQSSKSAVARAPGLTVAPLGRGLTAAVVTATPPDWFSGLADNALRLISADAEGAEWLPCHCPDILFVNNPSVLTDRRMALLIAQLRWGRPDLVVVLADGMIGVEYGFDHDISFDPSLGQDHVRTVLAAAISLLDQRRGGNRQSRRQPPALLRRKTPRRTQLFG